MRELNPRHRKKRSRVGKCVAYTSVVALVIYRYIYLYISLSLYIYTYIGDAGKDRIPGTERSRGARGRAAPKHEECCMLWVLYRYIYISISLSLYIYIYSRCRKG